MNNWSSMQITKIILFVIGGLVRKKAHNAVYDYCCACEYDIAVFEERLRQAQKEIEDKALKERNLGS